MLKIRKKVQTLSKHVIILIQALKKHIEIIKGIDNASVRAPRELRKSRENEIQSVTNDIAFRFQGNKKTNSTKSQTSNSGQRVETCLFMDSGRQKRKGKWNTKEVIVEVLRKIEARAQLYLNYRTMDGSRSWVSRSQNPQARSEACFN